jgi:hypothetical protein
MCCWQALDISADVQDNALVSAAVDEFRKIEMYRSPAEKISCVVLQFTYTILCIFSFPNSISNLGKVHSGIVRDIDRRSACEEGAEGGGAAGEERAA